MFSGDRLKQSLELVVGVLSISRVWLEDWTNTHGSRGLTCSVAKVNGQGVVTAYLSIGRCSAWWGMRLSGCRWSSPAYLMRSSEPHYNGERKWSGRFHWRCCTVAANFV